MKLTKQGVRDLGGGRPACAHQCQHFFAAQLVVVGHRWVRDPDYFEEYEEPIYGQRCLHCGETRE